MKTKNDDNAYTKGNDEIYINMKSNKIKYIKQ